MYMTDGESIRGAAVFYHQRHCWAWGAPIGALPMVQLEVEVVHATLRIAALQFATALLVLGGMTAATAAPLWKRSPVATESVFVASARVQDQPGTQAARNNGALRFSRYTVTIPPSHRLGGLSSDFRIEPTTGYESKGSFIADLLQHTQAEHGTREVVVLVHGANSGFAGGVRRAAQMSTDLGSRATMILFSWPSANRLDGYLGDVERGAAATANLEELLDILGRSDVSRVVLVGHSFGVSLIMDTLAQMRSKGGGEVFAKLGVALLSPDMAIEDFKVTAKQIGDLPAPIAVYFSSRDWALRLLADITDKRQRLGALTDPAEFADLNLILVDVAAAGTTDLVGHYAVAGQGRLVEVFNQLPDPDFIRFAQVLQRGVLSGTRVVRYGRTTHVVLPPPGGR